MHLWQQLQSVSVDLHQLWPSGHCIFPPFFFIKLLKFCQVALGLREKRLFQAQTQVLDCRILILLFWSRSCVALALFLRSSSCWKINLLPNYRFLGDCIRFSGRISVCCCIHLTLTSPPGPAAEKPPHPKELPTGDALFMMMANGQIELSSKALYTLPLIQPFTQNKGSEQPCKAQPGNGTQPCNQWTTRSTCWAIATPSSTSQTLMMCGVWLHILSVWLNFGKTAESPSAFWQTPRYYVSSF